MAYGIIKVDTIIFDQGGADQNVTVSGIYRAITSGVTVSGTISGAVLVGTTTVSGTTVTGTTANFASGVFTTQVSGATVTGTQSSFTSGNFVTLSGATATFTSGVIASGTAAAPSLSIVGDGNTGIYSPGADQVAVATSGTRRLDVNSSGQFRIGDGGTVGIFSAQAVANGNLHIRDIASVIGSGTGVALDVLNDAGSAVQDLAIRGTNTIFRNSAGETLRITSAGLVGIGTTGPVSGNVAILNVRQTGGNLSTTTVTRANVQGIIAADAVSPTNNYGNGIWFDSGSLIAGIASTRANTANWGTDLRFYTHPTTTTNQDETYERLRIDPAGNVGIGTTSPSSPLQVVGEISSGAAGTNGSISLRRTSDGASINSIAYDSATEEMRLNNGSGNGRIVFQTVSTERARIDSSGRLLVGTSSARSTFYSTASAFIQIEGGVASGSESLAIVRNANDVFGGSLILAKTRGTGDTIVTSGDTIGNVTWQGNDGSKFVQAARIEAQVDGTPGANDMPGRLVFFTTADGQATPTERMRIDALGALKTSPNGTYKFPAGTTEITHNDATSSVQLIASSTGFTGDAVTISTYRNTVNDSYKFLSCIRQGFAVALEIRDDGDVYNVNGTYGSLSDVKLKENIVDANSQWDDIRQLRVRNYNFKPETNNSTHKQIGVIAQEIEDVSPGLVNTVPDRDEDGNDLGTVTKSVNYSVLYMKAVKALQEAMTRIETLEADVALLKSA